MQDPAWADYQRRMDEGNMRTLVILHRVHAAWYGLGGLCLGGYSLFIVGIFSVAAVAQPSARASAPPAIIASFMGAILLFAFGMICLLATLNLLAANWIRDRRNWTGTILVSALNCLHVPLGTGLGVFTIIMLNKPDVRGSFQ